MKTTLDLHDGLVAEAHRRQRVRQVALQAVGVRAAYTGMGHADQKLVLTRVGDLALHALQRFAGAREDNGAGAAHVAIGA